MIGIMMVKGESDRLPGKNFLEINGKPLWQHNVDKMKIVCSQVHVITDRHSHDLIKHDSKVKRPEWITDNSSDVLKWFVDTYTVIDDYLITQATNPLLDVEFLEDCVRIYTEMGLTNMISINPATCKPDGNVYITASTDIFTEDMWVIHRGGLNEQSCDIDTRPDYCIANAIINGRVIDVQ